MCDTSTPRPDWLLEAFALDGAKWGPSDFYSANEEALRRALADGSDFDTGWYGVKKEVQSARVSRQGSAITCRVSCSDDFDTAGRGEVQFETSPSETVATVFERIVTALNEAGDLADADRAANALYCGFSVGPSHDGETLDAALYTYLVARGEGCELDRPPGDYYWEWGWHDDGGADSQRIPESVRGVLMAWADAFVLDDEDGDLSTAPSCCHDGWLIQPWR